MSSSFTPPEPESLPRDRSLFRVNPMSYLVLLVLVLAILAPVAQKPLALGWLVLIPVAFAWWVARTRTRVDDRGVRLTSWRGSRTVPWDEVRGVMFPRRGFARLVTTSGERPMGGVSFNDLPRLARASRGRIRDPYSEPVAPEGTASS